jgi:hypothetical protein
VGEVHPDQRRLLQVEGVAAAAAGLAVRDGEKAGMRVMFFAYALFIAAGLGYFIVIGLTHH